MFQRVNKLRAAVRVVLEIAEANDETGEPQEDAQGGARRGRSAAPANANAEEWADRVKGILYELVDAIAERF